MSELQAVKRHAEILVVDSARNVARTGRLLVVAFTLILLLFVVVTFCLVAVAVLFCRLNALQLHVEQCQLMPQQQQQQQQHRGDTVRRTSVHQYYHHDEHEDIVADSDSDEQQQMTSVQRPRRHAADSSNNKNNKNKNKPTTEQQRPAAEMVPVVHFQTAEIHFHRIEDDANVHRVLGGWKQQASERHHRNHTITKNGFYMIYAQMEYHTTDSLNGFAVVVRGKRNSDISNITRCLTGVDISDASNPKLKTCYAATVAQLDKGQTLELHDLSLNDFQQPKDFMYPSNCYWGIVQLVPRRK